LLATQHLDEADRLADWVTLLSEGRVVASAPPAELKAQVGARTVTARLADPADLPTAVRALRGLGLCPVWDHERTTVSVPVLASRDIALVVRALDTVAVEADELAFAEPDLDEAYLTLISGAGRPPVEPRDPEARR
jgi:ABC-2 type transport system ATP-binding protein